MPEFDGNCDFDVVKYFLKLLEDDDLSSGIAAIETLLMILEKKHRYNTYPTKYDARGGDGYAQHRSLNSCGYFRRLDDRGSMEECREIMLHRGQIFLAKLQNSRNVIAQQAQKFITDGCRVLVHSRSRVVLKALLTAAKANKQFHVYITQGGPDRMGEQMMNEMESAGIDCTLILDAAIGYVMESVDFVMVGAEAVVESGGIVNRVGTFTMALCAREMKKPFYYARKDLSDVSKVHPSVDYTPPAYITLLFTDLGILTPSAVSDELIKLYM
uniref:Uncharacterized protein n=1 Tax=Glossina austeni TaxID=7395 RepID=A0A1A9VSM5_GLOAU